MKREDVSAGASVDGLEPSGVVTVAVALLTPPETVQLVYRRDGSLRDRLLSRAEDSINVAAPTRPWSFDGDAAAFRLTSEAKRIDLALVFDPTMAVHTSNVEPSVQLKLFGGDA